MAEFAEDVIKRFMEEQDREREEAAQRRLQGRNYNPPGISTFGYGNDTVNLGGSYVKDKNLDAVQGRLGFNVPFNESSGVEFGASGHYTKGKGFKDIGLDKADATLKKRFQNDSEVRAKLRANLNEQAGKRGLDELKFEYEIPFKKGGKVKKKAPARSSASKRGDGCAKKGHTKGKFR
jgi:hypothetical protein